MYLMASMKRRVSEEDSPLSFFRYVRVRDALALLLFFAGFFVCHYLTWYWPDSPVFGRPDAAPAREASPAQSAVEPAAPEKSLADWQGIFYFT